MENYGMENYGMENYTNAELPDKYFVYGRYQERINHVARAAIATGSARKVHRIFHPTRPCLSVIC